VAISQKIVTFKNIVDAFGSLKPKSSND